MELLLWEKCERLKTPQQLRWLFVVVKRKSLTVEKIMKKNEALIQKQMVMIAAAGVLYL